MTRHIPLSAPGLWGEIFWVLAHPVTACINIIILASAFLLSFEIDHILIQSCMGLLVFQALAQAEDQARPAQLSLRLWALGGFFMCIGLFNGYDQAGQMLVSPGSTLESYQRGKEITVDYHFGNPLSLSYDNNHWTWRLGTGVSDTLANESWLKGHSAHVGPWRLNVLGTQSDTRRLQVTFNIQPRDGTWQKKVTLREGDSFTEDGQVVMRVLNIVKNRGGSASPNMGAAAEVLVNWQDSKTNSKQIEHVWHYVNATDLNRKFGVSPWILSIEKIDYATLYQVRVQKHTSQAMIYWGLIAWVMGLLSICWQSIQTSSTTSKTEV